MEHIIAEKQDAGGRMSGPLPPQGLRTNALVVLGLVFATSLVFYHALSPYLMLGSGAIAFAATLQFMIFALVMRALPYHHHKVFGAANAVTAIRTAIVSLVAATVLFAADLLAAQSAVWIMICLVLVALVLDGFDGYLARFLGQDSALGARFDMEVDALLILVLSAAGLVLDKVGWWVLAIGLMRYGFVAAQCFIPALGQPLPPAFRRKLICVIQVGALCFILVPAVAPPSSTVAAAVALALLTYSFAVDVIYLLGKERSEP